jgi:hypothetical protein
MATSESMSVLKCDNLLASSRGLTETYSKKVVLFVPAAEIDHVILKFGHTSHRPILTMILGLIFVPIGIYGLFDLFIRPAGLRYEMGMVAFGLIGGSLIFDTLKKRYFLEVHQMKSTSRLVFSRNATLESILDFCANIEATYHYKVTNATEQDAAANP